MMHSSCNKWFLHHVAQCPGFVVELAAAFHAQFLGHRDLHVFDQSAPPQRLEQCIAETQRHEILHRLLAEVVIDAINLFLGEHLADLGVDEVGGLGVVSQRFLQHHPRERGHDRGLGQVPAYHGETGSMRWKRKTRGWCRRGPRAMI